VRECKTARLHLLPPSSLNSKKRIVRDHCSVYRPPMIALDGDYVLGTGDVEIERLALQHRVWRPRALDAWRRAGITVGQTVVDVGCGPGYATIDIANIVGPSGQVIAIDQSRRFLDVVEAQRRHQRLENVHPLELDLSAAPLPELRADAAWCRWVLCFVSRPRDVLDAMVRAVRPGGVLVLHEYFDYRTWRLAPRSPELEEFVAAVMASWRASGGEPDVALDLPGWLEQAGCRIESLQPIVDVVPPTSYTWQWPAGFIASGLVRLVELGHLTADRSAAIAAAFARAEREPQTRMITPAVMEVIARRG
jgi:SAM-dependent methyltransferase